MTTTTTPALASLTAGQGFARLTRQLNDYANDVDTITAHILAARERLTSETGEAAMTAATAETATHVELKDGEVISLDLYRALNGEAHTEAALFGFGWSCHKDGHEESGRDRGEFTAHMRGHGLKSPQPSCKPIRLRKATPAAPVRKLEINPLKWLHWTEDHVIPGTCGCGHSGTEHTSVWDHSLANGHRPSEANGCQQCGCQVTHVEPLRQSAKRRGQFLANAPRAHTFWVIPFEPAPWEFGRAQAVEVHLSQLNGGTGRDPRLPAGEQV